MFGDKIEWQHAQTGERRTGVATGVEWQEHNALAVWTPFGITVVHRDNVLAVNDEPPEAAR